MDFRFGIEHEVAFVDREGRLLDFTQAKFQDLARIVEVLPRYPEDYPQLRVGDAGIKEKRWYVEGFERFNLHGELLDCVPKGIEVRTTIHSAIRGAVEELGQSFDQLSRAAAAHGYAPALLSFNPQQIVYQPDPPLNSYETARRQGSPEKRTAEIPMLTYGPDLNLSSSAMSANQVIGLGEKLTYYSPFIVPFSFSSPFFGGGLWDGLSVRTYHRTGPRPAAMVFLADEVELIESEPSLTKRARLPAEAGRIEFKAFDSCGDFRLYGSLLALLKGLALDSTMRERTIVPDAALHRLSAKRGFAADRIRRPAEEVLSAAETALEDDPDLAWLEPLRVLLESRETPAHRLISLYESSGSVAEAAKAAYALG
ncbi:MAG: glutamate--cysteine ligase [Anaerolineae bacterium]